MVWRIKNIPVTASTNDDVRTAAEAGEPEGLVIQAMRQTSGRGRRGREWESPEGNLYGSVLLRPPEEPRHYGWYSFVAALAVRDALTDCLKHCLPMAPAITLKWPNDVLVEGQKISGILLEAGEGYLVIGIGLNIARCPQHAFYPVTSLASYISAPPSVLSALTLLLEHLEHWLDVLRNQGFAPIRAAWSAQAQQGVMTVKLPTETLQGEFTGLNDNGALHLRLADGAERVIAAGDVFFEETHNAACD